MKISFYIFSFLTACCLATPFPVTENGRAVADIVLSADADVTLRHAADELQLWIKDITGAELPVRSRLESCRGTSGLARRPSCNNATRRIFRRWTRPTAMLSGGTEAIFIFLAPGKDFL